MRLAICLLLLAACADDRVTYGDGCASLATAFCSRTRECEDAWPDAGTVDAGPRATKDCEIDLLARCCSPGVEFFCDDPGALESDVSACLAEIDDDTCTHVETGFPPPSCFKLQAIGP